MKIEQDLRLTFYEKMLTVRQFENKIVNFARQGKIYGSVHLCVGEEAASVGSCFVLKETDYLLPTHRGHGQAIAKGSDINTLLAEVAAKKTGVCKGRVGSMHFFDKTKNVLGGQGILGAQFPISIGVGLSIKLRQPDTIAACYFGDGTSNQGTFYESLNFADIFELPIFYVCINNLYGMGTRYDKTCKISITKKAELFNLKTDSADGNDIEEVYEKSLKLAEYVRKNRKPALIELFTYRHLGHSALDSRPYRPKEEIEEWFKKDPIERYEKKLIKEGISSLTLEEITKKVEMKINEAEKFALESDFPEFTNDMEM